MLSLKEKQKALISALARGTVCVSVHAWKKNEHGNYYKDPQDGDNHWVQLVDYKMGDYWIIRDTYAPFEKRVEWDTNFQSAKLFFLSVNESGLTPNKSDFFALTLKWILDKLKKIMPSQDHLTEIPLSEKYPEPLMEKESNREKLYRVSKESIGTDLTPDDKIDDTVACVAQFQAVYKKAFGTYMGSGPALYSTKYLVEELRKNPDVVAIPWEDVVYGDIVCFGTGENKYNNAPNIRGHVFVAGKNDWMSNNSQTGLWSAHKTRTQIQDYYITFCGFPVDKSCFRLRG